MHLLPVLCAAFANFTPPRSILRPKMANVSAVSSPDKWSAQANLYSDQAVRITELHGADLVTILRDDILRAETILDVGAGTGAFARAYMQQFPKGVPNQTLILTDLSPGMLEKAKEKVIPPPDFQTKLVFQEEDGTKLEGIPDDSIDLVISLFGVFLIPDQEATQKAIRRVLKKDGAFGNGSWIFGLSETLTSHGFGVSAQDAFQVPMPISNPDFRLEEAPFYTWSDRNRAKTILSEKYKFRDVEVYSALHTTGMDFEKFWVILLNNPVSNLTSVSAEDQQKAKEALMAFVTSDGSKLDKPLLMSSASILSVGRGSESE